MEKDGSAAFSTPTGKRFATSARTPSAPRKKPRTDGDGALTSRGTRNCGTFTSCVLFWW